MNLLAPGQRIEHAPRISQLLLNILLRVRIVGIFHVAIRIHDLVPIDGIFDRLNLSLRRSRLRSLAVRSVAMRSAALRRARLRRAGLCRAGLCRAGLRAVRRPNHAPNQEKRTTNKKQTKPSRHTHLTR